MQSVPAPRVRIANLAPPEQLSPEEMARILRAGRPKFKPGIEMLEDRQLLAASLTANLTAGTLTIEGTQQVDRIRILQTADHIEVFNDAAGTRISSIPVQAVNQIVVNALGEDDIITLDPSVRVAALLSGGAGLDRFEVPADSSAVQDFQSGDILMEFPSGASGSSGQATSQSSLADGLNQLLDREIIAWKYTTPGTLNLNLLSQTFYADIDLGAGIKIDTTLFQTWLNDSIKEGKISYPRLPQADPLKAMATAAGLEMHSSSNYREIRQQIYDLYGAENIYFASERFVEWASPETAARFAGIIAAATAAGNADKGVDMVWSEIESMLKQEWGDIKAWFFNNTRAPNEFVPEYPLLAGKILQSLWNGWTTNMGVTRQFGGKSFPPGQKLHLPGIANPEETLSLHLVGIDYTATLEHRWIQGQQREIDAPPHLGFFLAWGHGPDSQDKINPITRALERDGDGNLRFDHFKQTKPEDTLPGFIGNTAAGGLLERLAFLEVLTPGIEASDASLRTVGAELVSAATDTLVFRLLADKLDIDGDEVLSRCQESNPLVDLTGTAPARELEAFLSGIAQGNRSSVRIRQFELNLTDYSVSIKFELNHKHSWGSANDIVEGIFKTISQWGEKTFRAIDDWNSRFGTEADRAIAQQSQQLTELVDQLGEELLTSQNKALTQVTEWVKEARKALDRWEKDQIDDLNDWADRLRNSITSWVKKNASGAVDDVLKELSSWSKTAVKDASRWFDDQANSISRWVSEQTGKIFGNGFAQVGNLVRQLQSSVLSAGQVVNRAIESAADGVEDVIDLQTDLARAAMKKAADAVNSTIHGQADLAKKAINPAVREAKRAISNQLDLIEEVLDKEAGIIRNSIRAVTTEAKGVIRDQSAALRQLIRLQTRTVHVAADTAADLCRDTVREEMQKARQEVLELLLASIQSNPANDPRTFTQAISNQVLGRLARQTAEKMRGFKAEAGKVLANAKQEIHKGLVQARKEIQKVIDQVRDQGTHLLKDARNIYSKAATHLKKEAGKLVDRAMGRAKDAFSQAKKVGEKAIKDAREKARKALDTAKKAVSTALSNAKDKAKDAIKCARDDVNRIVTNGRQQVANLQDAIQAELDRIAREAQAAAEQAAQAAREAANRAARAVKNVGKKLKF